MKKKLLVATIFAVTIGLAGCSSPTTPQDNSAEIESLKSQVESLQAENNELKKSLEAAEAATEPETSEAQDSSTGSVLMLNEEGILEDWAITVSNTEITDYIKENDYAGFTPDDDNRYLAIEISVTNNGKSASTFLPSFGIGDSISAKILYQNDYEFSSTNLLGYSKGMHDSTINPFSTKTGVIAFEIPDSVASSEDELLLVISAGNKNLQFKIR